MVRCRNHVRTIYRVVDSDEIYVCATGANNPQEFYLNVRQILRCLFNVKWAFENICTFWQKIPVETREYVIIVFIL